MKILQGKISNDTQIEETQSMLLSEDEESRQYGPGTVACPSREGNQETSISYLTKENMGCPSSNAKQF